MQIMGCVIGIVTAFLGAKIAPNEITTDTVWTASSGPYFVSGSTSVLNGATLTIEAGVTVKFAKNSELRIGNKTSGKLVVKGKAEAPVLFISDSGESTPGAWIGISARYRGSSIEMENAILRGAGADDKSSPNGVRYALSVGPDIPCNLTAVTIQNCTRGIELDTESDVFLKNCTIKDCTNEAISAAQEVAHAIDMSNTIVGNGINAIVIGDVGDTEFTKPRTWSNTAIPYYIRGDLLVDGPASGVSLTLAPGVSIMLDRDASITVGWDHQADLIAAGTAEKPIVFRSFQGKWDGIYLGLTSSATLFSHCRFLDGGSVQAMLIADENSKGNVNNCRFENSDTWAISLEKGANLQMANNSFSGNKLGDIDR